MYVGLARFVATRETALVAVTFFAPFVVAALLALVLPKGSRKLVWLAAAAVLAAAGVAAYWRMTHPGPEDWFAGLPALVAWAVACAICAFGAGAGMRARGRGWPASLTVAVFLLAALVTPFVITGLSPLWAWDTLQTSAARPGLTEMQTDVVHPPAQSRGELTKKVKAAFDARSPDQRTKALLKLVHPALWANARTRISVASVRNGAGLPTGAEYDVRTAVFSSVPVSAPLGDLAWLPGTRTTAQLSGRGAKDILYEPITSGGSTVGNGAPLFGKAGFHGLGLWFGRRAKGQPDAVLLVSDAGGAWWIVGATDASGWYGR
jgi:hypothetical protein